jgi:hypothetical protein
MPPAIPCEAQIDEGPAAGAGHGRRRTLLDRKTPDI